MDSRSLETGPKHTAEEPGGAPDAIPSGKQRERAVQDVLTGNVQGIRLPEHQDVAREK